MSTTTEIVKVNIVDISVAPERLNPPTDIADRIPYQIDVISPTALEPVLFEIEHSKIEASVIYDLETPFDLDSTAFEQPEEALSTDNIYLDTGIVEGNTGSIDFLLVDLEEGMQRVEAEYIGKLLVGVFVDFVETDVIDEQKDMLDVQLSQTTVIGSAESASNNHESTTLQDFEEQFNFYLESLEPSQVEYTKNVIEALSIVIRESQQLPEEATNEEKEIIEQKLEELCIQLFESLGIEYDEETIKQFMQSITQQESFVNLNIETDALSTEALNNMGTREYKPPEGASLLGGLAQYIKHKMQPHLTLGKYALQAVA